MQEICPYLVLFYVYREQGAAVLSQAESASLNSASLSAVSRSQYGKPPAARQGTADIPPQQAEHP